MAVANRYFVDPDYLLPRLDRPIELSPHARLVQFLYRVPVKMKLAGPVLDARRATAPAHHKIKSIGIRRIVQKKSSRSRFTLPAISAQPRRVLAVIVSTLTPVGPVSAAGYAALSLPPRAAISPGTRDART